MKAVYIRVPSMENPSSAMDQKVEILRTLLESNQEMEETSFRDVDDLSANELIQNMKTGKRLSK